MKKLLLVFVLFSGFATVAMAQTPTQKVYAAVVKNKPTDVDALLKAGADPNAPVEMMPGFPTSFLILAAGRSQTETVKVLLQHKALVNKPDSFNATALMAAAGEGNAELVTLLLAAGADPKLKDNDGKDAMASAKESGNAEVVKLLQAKMK
ncbi:ankyrin repeat domain-containing protein [Hymenobacter tibetensis]|uniref:Ankyrin repeat domain-containing protein n=1 Tax=Hymenobacter tibetensis TaxID=497967 RepID=A0ABY4CZK9_9BACT|nr:ankyrin repeat domain-containing protein [Hymenobacter tibetensis]UOG73103.1 ankyrin repeat domain-containing protein [Hymenobacter tibetensis]